MASFTYNYQSPSGLFSPKLVLMSLEASLIRLIVIYAKKNMFVSKTSHLSVHLQRIEPAWLPNNFVTRLH